MKTTRRIVDGLVFCVTVFACGAHLAAELPPQSYASAEELKEMYMSMNSMIHNYRVSYTHTLVDQKRSSVPEPVAYVRFEAVEVLREGPRFWARSHFAYTLPTEESDIPPERFGQAAFDGTASSMYVPNMNAGQITPGLANNTTEESTDQFLVYTMTLKATPDTDPNYTLLDFYMGCPNPPVRPRLEQVNGHWCHVVDSAALDPNKAYGGVVWMAADKGGLPIKAERYARGKCTLRHLISEVGSLDTDTGTFYYPKKATSEQYGLYGYKRYELEITSLRLNVETSPEMFRVTFPPGTMVADRVMDIYYTTGPVTEESRFGAIKGPIEKEKHGPPSSVEPAMNPNIDINTGPPLQVAQPASSDFDDEESRTPLLLALVAAVAVAAVILVLFVRNKGKRTTRAQ